MSVTTPGLPLPNLDDRRWTDLVEEGRSLIPLYAPEWTDHNASDPGITLIELLAWLAEQQIFRTDRLGQAGLVKLLKLAGGVAAPPRPARAVLSVSTANGHPSATVAAGTEFEGNTPDGNPVRFRTLEDTVVAEATLGAFQIQNGEAFIDRTSALSHQQWVAAWGDSPGPGSVFVLGFSKALPADAEVSLYFVVRDPDESDAERARLVKEFGESGATNHHSVRLAWEAWAGPGLWVPLEARDETRALTLNGRVRLTGSDLMADTVLGRVESKFFYVRARIVSGRHDAAPRLRAVIANAVVVEQAVVPGAARKAKQPTGDGVPAGQLFEPLASGDGWPGQVRSVSSPSVANGDIVVLSPDGSGWKPWQRKDDFDASRRTSSDFVLDAGLGQIRFGDGEHGRTLPNGEQLYASYLSTVHEAGNIAARSVTRLVEKNPQVGAISQPLPAWGGRAGEVPDDVHARILDDLKSVTRAVTLQDCETLAKSVPGGVVSVARGTAESHPDLPGVPCPGVVSLIVLPLLPANLPDPTPGLLRLVSCYLNRRTVPGTRIDVAGPVYRKVTVRAQIRIDPASVPAVVIAAAGAALRRFFHPLQGGPEGTGWPVGRVVFHTEVLSALGATPGATGVPSLEMTLDGGPPLCANLCLGPRGLPDLGPLEIAIAPSTPGRDGRACP